MRELEQIYIDRGLEPALARQVAKQLTAKDALSAHARDELGFTVNSGANPLQAAAASALAFSMGAALPTLVAVLAPQETLIAAVSIATLIFLVGLGALGGWLGGATLIRARPAGRVLGRHRNGCNCGNRRAGRESSLAVLPGWRYRQARCLPGRSARISWARPSQNAAPVHRIWKWQTREEPAITPHRKSCVVTSRREEDVTRPRACSGSRWRWRELWDRFERPPKKVAAGVCNGRR